MSHVRNQGLCFWSPPAVSTVIQLLEMRTKLMVPLTRPPVLLEEVTNYRLGEVSNRLLNSRQPLSLSEYHWGLVDLLWTDPLLSIHSRVILHPTDSWWHSIALLGAWLEFAI